MLEILRIVTRETRMASLATQATRACGRISPDGKRASIAHRFLFDGTVRNGTQQPSEANACRRTNFGGEEPGLGGAAERTTRQTTATTTQHQCRQTAIGWGEARHRRSWYTAAKTASRRASGRPGEGAANAGGHTPTQPRSGCPGATQLVRCTEPITHIADRAHADCACGAPGLQRRDARSN